MKEKNYLKWKNNYEISRIKDRKSNIIKIISAIIIALILYYTFFLFWNDEARFFGRKTIVKKGIIIETKFIQRGSAGYYQKADYKFTFEGNSYQTYFWGTKITGEQFVGDSIKIKFEVNNPKNSKYISKD